MSRSDSPLRRRDASVAVLVAATLSIGWYAAFGDVGLLLQDEGFLWYGVQRVVEGDVPLRDFQAYDPGRYYWCAFWTPLFGDGVLGVRRATAVFAGVGLLCGLLVARRVVRSNWALLPVGTVLLLWMFPRHKSFDAAVPMIAVLAAVRLIESPGARRHFVAGVVVGLSAFVGRNHGVYLALAFAALIAFLAWKREDRALPRLLGAWCGGVALGYAPALVMMVALPGFARSSYAWTLFFLERGTNLPLPYPWPWRSSWSGLSAGETVRSAALAAAFLLPLVAYPVGLFLALRTPRDRLARSAVLIASSFVGVVYLHHVSARSDVPHLAQSIAPLFLLCLAIPDQAVRRRAALRGAAGAALAGLTLLVCLDNHPLLQRIRAPASSPPLVTHRVGEDELRLEKPLAAYLERMEAAIAAHVPAGEPMFFLTTRPMFYSIFARRSPFWEIFTTWPESPERQRRMIDQLESQEVAWGFVVDVPMDGRMDLLFSQSHPLLWSHLLREFEPVATPALPRTHLLLRRRGARTRAGVPAGGSAPPRPRD